MDTRSGLEDLIPQNFSEEIKVNVLKLMYEYPETKRFELSDHEYLIIGGHVFCYYVRKGTSISTPKIKMEEINERLLLKVIAFMTRHSGIRYKLLTSVAESIQDNKVFGVMHSFIAESSDEELVKGVNVIKGQLEIKINNPDIYYIGIIPNVLFKGVEPIAISIGDREIEFNNYIRQAGSDWNWHPEPLTLSVFPKGSSEFELDINIELQKTDAAKKGDGVTIILEILLQEPDFQNIITAGIIRKEVK